MIKNIYKSLVFRVLLAICLGVLFGLVLPSYADEVKFFSDVFIRLVSLLVGPIIFCTIVGGIVGHGDVKAVGKIAIIAIIYFEIITTFALGLGLWSSYLFQPGVGINVHNLDVSQIDSYVNSAQQLSVYKHLLNIVPQSFVAAFADSNLLQILFFSVFFGVALVAVGDKTKIIKVGIDQFGQVMFRLLHYVVEFAPFAAFGAMGYTVSKFGLGILLNFGSLIASVYFTMILFVGIVLGGVCRYVGVSLWELLKFIKEELLITLGTSSSESVLPQLMEKLELFGCDKEVVGLVVPTGYSFNLDGTAIYLSAAVIFIAQAYGVQLTFAEEAFVFGLLMLNSKGAAAVTGGGFVTLAATLAATDLLPIEGLVLLLGVDRFMSEARAVTNIIGNSVAAVVVSRWHEKSLVKSNRLV